MDALSYEDFSLFISALKFCSEKHRDQRRKDAVRTPYLNHPIEVAEILWTVGKVREMNVLIGALLHDVIEDTETGPEEIGSRFGEEVLSLVLEVTDDKRLPKSKRKELQVLHAPRLSSGAKLIKIADKIGNVRDVTWSPPPDWSLTRRIEYLEWAERVVQGLGVESGEMLDLFYKVLTEGRRELET
jgi:guanosine-3',5'-bis(diphosphate) 3'-pyrophosphohydrolase